MSEKHTFVASAITAFFSIVWLVVKNKLFFHFTQSKRHNKRFDKYIALCFCNLSALLCMLTKIHQSYPPLATYKINSLWMMCRCVLLGPGQYDLRVKSFPQMALITSRDDRFKVSANTNPGPGAYEVNMLLNYSLVTLLKPFHTWIPDNSRKKIRSG